MENKILFYRAASALPDGFSLADYEYRFYKDNAGKTILTVTIDDLNDGDAIIWDEAEGVWKNGVGAVGPEGPPGEQGPPGADGDGTAYYGQISTQTSQTVTITTAGDYEPMAITGTFDTNNSYGTVASGFGIENDSGSTQLFTVIATADVSVGNNKTTGLRLAVNGFGIPATVCTATTGTQNFAKLISQWMVELEDGDVVSCELANITDTANINVQRAKIVAFTAGRQGEEGPEGPIGPAGISSVTSPLVYDSETQELSLDAFTWGDLIGTIPE